MPGLSRKEAPVSKKGSKKTLKHQKEEAQSTRDVANCGLYAYKVLQETYPDTSISSKAMSMLSSFINDAFDRIASEASRVARYNERWTLTSKDIEKAVFLLLPEELAKEAVSEGNKAVARYTRFK